MRRLLQCVTGICLFATVVGCNLTTGVCDCEPHGCGSIPGCAGCNAGRVSVAAPAPQGENIKEMPKTVDK